MQKIIDELISSFTEGVDVYRWKDSTWLIFTNETRWVVELTDEGTLWYNYRFFNDVFRYVSMEIGQQSEKYIIEWANGFFFKDCAHRSVAYPMDKDRAGTEKVLANGIQQVVKSSRTLGEDYIEKVVEGGIKETQGRGKNHGDEFEWHTRAVIDNGIKNANDSSSVHRQMRAENVMNKIIKEVRPNRVTVHDEKMDRFYYDPGCSANTTDIWMVVEEGVKEIKSSIWTTKRGVDIADLMCNGNTTDINIIVEKGVKNIYPDKSPDDYDWSDEFKADNVIQGGMKVIPLPDPSGELRGYSDYYNTKEDRTKPHTEYVKDAIDGGTKL
jgi:hypothetical protein